MKNNDKYGVGAEGDFSRSGVSRKFLLVASVCWMISGSTIAQAEYKYMVKIPFNDSGCPQDPMNMKWEDDHWVDNTDIKLTADQDTIFWQAYDLAGTNTGNNTYKIYFDPFKKPSLTADSNDNGKTKTKKTKKNNEIPTGVFFKYTIWADACPDYPKDPRFQVQ